MNALVKLSSFPVPSLRRPGVGSFHLQGKLTSIIKVIEYYYDYITVHHRTNCFNLTCTSAC